ncbi:MAG: thiamine-phosphate kinase [Dehalococcoidia bacterium]|nr:thiamine-phosphate kinase [Dehalococcoidia bacterium]
MTNQSDLHQLGEFGLIDRIDQLVRSRRLRRGMPGPNASPLAIAIGDDAAAWHSGAAFELSKTDTMVEGVHFTRRTAAWSDVGWKVMVANQSDIAAMGGEPTYALVTLGLAADIAISAIEDLYAGLLDACDAHGGDIVGGDIVRSPVFFITISLSGIATGPLLLRSAARPGDLVAVTGTLGGAEGGLRMLQRNLKLDAATAKALKLAHLHRTPRIAEGKALLAAGVRCAMDISDGLAADLSKLCRASNVSARLNADALPLHPSVRKAFPQEARDMALSSGEEYELLFAAPADVMQKALPTLSTSATIIGEILPGAAGAVTVVDAEGQPVPLSKTGWDHVRS